MDTFLLVCEKGKWSLPRGWCEFNLSPADNTIKETKEEAGLDVSIKMVIAVQDRDKHNLLPLAEEKCNEEQIRMCFDACQSDGWTVVFD